MRRVYKLLRIELSTRSLDQLHPNMLTYFLLVVGLAAAFADNSAIGGRIVGGRNGNIEEVPYLVSIQLLGSHHCGGTIISENWVVSAAHCFTIPPVWFSIRAGSTTKNTGGTVHRVQTIINHAFYGWPTRHSNDIAVLKVSSAFLFSASVRPASLPSDGQSVNAGTWSRISGWGDLAWQGSAPTILQIADVPIVSRAQCGSWYGSSRITDDMLCAGFAEGGVDACQRDSGGPLVINNVLFGAVAWGEGCAVAQRPTVYASVPFLRNWIRLNTGV